MPSFAVKQPNGLYASFSTIVDNFTAADQAHEDAFNYWLFEAGRVIAKNKIRNADTEARSSISESQEPLSRWRGALRTVLAVHGVTGLREALADFDMTAAERKRWLDDAKSRVKP